MRRQPAIRRYAPGFEANGTLSNPRKRGVGFGRIGHVGFRAWRSPPVVRIVAISRRAGPTASSSVRRISFVVRRSHALIFARTRATDAPRTLRARVHREMRTHPCFPPRFLVRPRGTARRAGAGSGCRQQVQKERVRTLEVTASIPTSRSRNRRRRHCVVLRHEQGISGCERQTMPGYSRLRCSAGLRRATCVVGLRRALWQSNARSPTESVRQGAAGILPSVIMGQLDHNGRRRCREGEISPSIGEPKDEVVIEAEQPCDRDRVDEIILAQGGFCSCLDIAI